jgi:predicted nucleotidyltransferase component of viral defense system
MLQTQTVVPELMELLRKLMKVEEFSNFYLVGGTSLSLQIGHRNSIDIDLFGNQNIDSDLFISILNDFGKTEVSKSSKNILITDVSGIKVDFVNYHYKLLDEPIEIEGIRMVSKKDIAAMKLNAIAGRGSKKDFIDLYYLLDEFSLKEMVDFYSQKYFDGSEFMVVKSLSYFEEANEQPQPQMMKSSFNWETCKQKISNEVIKLQ